MGGFRFLLVTAALLDVLLGAPSVLAREPSRIPTAEQIVEDFGDDAVRAGAACEVMRNAMIIAAGYKIEWDTRNSPIAKQYDALERCGTQNKNASAIQLAKIASLAEDPEFERTVAKRYLRDADYARWESYESVQWEIRRDLASRHRGDAVWFFMMLVVPLALCFFFIWRAFRPWRYDPESRILHFGGRQYEVHYNAGVVVQSDARHSTQHVPATETVDVDQYGGRRVTSATPGYSVTTLHETIHLVDKSGREMVMRLNDWGVGARRAFGWWAVLGAQGAVQGQLS